MSPFNAHEQFKQMQRQREMQEQQKRLQDMARQQQEQFRKQQQQFQDQMKHAAWQKKIEEENRQKQIQNAVGHARNRNQPLITTSRMDSNFPAAQPRSQGSSCLAWLGKTFLVLLTLGILLACFLVYINS